MVVHGTTKRDRLSWIVGSLFRMAYNCFTQTDVALSVCVLAVELELSGTASPRCLLSIALVNVSVIIYVIILEMQEERMKEFSRTFWFLYRMSGGL